MNRNRVLSLLFLMVVLVGCTTTILRLPGGGYVLQVVDFPTVKDSLTITPSPSPLATSTPAATPTESIPWIDPTPTPGEPVPTITPTWSTCQVDNYYVVVRDGVNGLAIRQTTISNAVDPLKQDVLRRVNAGTVLEVFSCLLETTPGGWLPIETDDNLQGIVHSGYVRVTSGLQE